MFFNLNAEMGRAKLTIKKLSEITAINYESLKLKLRGVTEFKLSEMMAIKRKAFPDKTCKDCRHRAKLRDDCYRCRKATSLLGTLEDYDGCSRGEEKC